MTKQKILQYFCDINMAYNDSSKYDSLSKMLDDLLKEQEPIKPIIDSGDSGSWWYRCSDCGREINFKTHFCQWCGKPLKWD